MKRKLLYYLTGVIGAGLVFFIGWEYNSPIVPWVSFPLLVYFFRNTNKWYKTLPIVLLMLISKFFCLYGGWDVGATSMAGFAIIVTVPLLASLYFDRFYSKSHKSLLATLVFPCTYIALDYLLTFAKVGMVFSLSYTQSTFLPIVQSESLLGSWFVGFLVAWFAPVAILLVGNVHNLISIRKPLITYFTILAVVLSFGCLRLVIDNPHSATVRIASITIPHDIDYWAITDEATPKEDAEQNKSITGLIQQELFSSSQRAADYGARIIFWSEGNCALYEDDYAAFLEKAKIFAKQNQVYFMPAAVELLYGETKNHNVVIMINPQGEIEFTYEKTYSWYPTDSDGIIHIIDTPYGKLSAAICFDMDYSNLIVQAKDADIMLVPAFDTKKIGAYHTRVAFNRGIENGFSVVRQDNTGTSIAADYMGNTISYQDYFNTADRVMISDVPTRGKDTVYGSTGEIFLWLVYAGFLFINVYFIKNKSENKKLQ